jgi:hypothetical protein
MLSALALALYAAAAACAAPRSAELGEFAAQSDVGRVTPRGNARYSAASDTYTLAGAGANTWYHVDDFHYLWKRMSDEVALTAEIRFPPVTYHHAPDPHRKGILMFRQTLDSGGVYADAVVHGSGMTALHLQELPPLTKGAPRVRYSTPRTIQTEDQYRRAMVIRTGTALMQSANWLPHHPNIYVYEGGHMLAIPYLDPAAGGEARIIDPGSLVDCSGNYKLAPDGRSLAVSCEQTHGRAHQVYVLPASGTGTARQVTAGAQSFLHAWSPDSKTIAFTRGSASKADIFTVPAAGGAVRQLTHDTINIWRMRTDGSAAEQITDDDCRNSSPHPSPDGKSLAFLAQPPETGDAIGAVAVKIVTLSDGLIRTLTQVQGNRDSFSMYGWGDNDHVAFVSYDSLPAVMDDARPC